jgi:hypothetical protein
MSRALAVRDACAAQPGGCPLCGEERVHGVSMAMLHLDDACETHRRALELVQARPYGDVFGRAGTDLDQALVREFGIDEQMARSAITAAWNAVRRKRQGFA